MSIDIFDLQDIARDLDLRNRTGQVPVSWIVAPSDNPPIERADGGTYVIPVVEKTLQCTECENILTIEDRGLVCRECRLNWPIGGEGATL
jgi:hypothetical protein